MKRVRWGWFVVSIIIIIIIIIKGLQPFVGPWLLFQFLDPMHSRYNSLERASARRKAAIYTQDNTNTENTHNTDIHAFSRIRTHERAKTVHALDRAATVIGF
jgi:hypothetical protein